MKTRHSKQKNTTSEIKLRKWCVEQVIQKNASVSPLGIREVIRCSGELYEWVVKASIEVPLQE